MVALVILLIFFSGLRITYVSLSNLLSRNNLEIFNMSFHEGFYIFGIFFGLILLISAIGSLTDKIRWKKIAYSGIVINLIYFLVLFADVYVNRPPIYKLSLFVIAIQVVIGILLVFYMKKNWLNNRA